MFVGDVAKTVLELILIIGLVGHVGWSMVYEIRHDTLPNVSSEPHKAHRAEYRFAFKAGKKLARVLVLRF